MNTAKLTDLSLYWTQDVTTVIKGIDLVALKAAAQLEYFRLRSARHFQIADTELLSLAECWPQLISMSLAVDPTTDDMERPSLSQLIILSIAKYCQRLEELEICIAYVADMGHSTIAYEIKQLDYLDLTNSLRYIEGDDLDQLAICVAHVLPNVETAEHCVMTNETGQTVDEERMRAAHFVKQIDLFRTCLNPEFTSVKVLQ